MHKKATIGHDELYCHERMPDEKALHTKKVKTLFKLARNMLFEKDYYCMHCGLTDFDKDYMKVHVKNHHDEYSQPIQKFRCKNCWQNTKEEEIIQHHTKHH